MLLGGADVAVVPPAPGDGNDGGSSSEDDEDDTASEPMSQEEMDRELLNAAENGDAAEAIQLLAAGASPGVEDMVGVCALAAGRTLAVLLPAARRLHLETPSAASPPRTCHYAPPPRAHTASRLHLVVWRYCPLDG